ncbi:hypothetical protein ACPOL_0453 [Acidisarcina polymorpha]|uniref:Uncharacterized protein n=1 Tax=Acidisarcina polymorpha TaxID=2211140 RepID=A0A2Z5FSN7_9BACT|nr:hypothetical protein ACPOL_0453 [Acidisarcina polymorpha]
MEQREKFHKEKIQSTRIDRLEEMCNFRRYKSEYSITRLVYLALVRSTRVMHVDNTRLPLTTEDPCHLGHDP